MFGKFFGTHRKEHRFARFSKLSDQEWLKVLTRSINEPVIDGVAMPGFPSDEIQTNSVGSAGAQTLLQAFNFYLVVKRYGERLGRPIKGASVLDFGCAWGRILRFFLRDCEPKDIWGIDVDPEFLSVCINTIADCNFLVVDPVPPTQLGDASFDIVIAFSVFSHLAEHASLRWVQEFSRILKPKGIMVVTTQGRDFIELCRSLRGRDHEFQWYRTLANCFVDSEAAYAAYDAGKYLHSPTGGGAYRPSDFYGETLIPEGYVLAHWTEYLRLADFVDDRNVLPQALIVMQKE